MKSKLLLPIILLVAVVGLIASNKKLPQLTLAQSWTTMDSLAHEWMGAQRSSSPDTTAKANLFVASVEYLLGHFTHAQVDAYKMALPESCDKWCWREFWECAGKNPDSYDIWLCGYWFLIPCLCNCHHPTCPGLPQQ